jgi:hypothetical protein
MDWIDSFHGAEGNGQVPRKDAGRSPIGPGDPI